MSQAEVVKQCKVKTNIAKRLNKELAYYEEERNREQARVDKMRADKADLYDLKQAVGPLRERSRLRLHDNACACAGDRAGRVGDDDPANVRKVGRPMLFPTAGEHSAHQRCSACSGWRLLIRTSVATSRKTSRTC